MSSLWRMWLSEEFLKGFFNLSLSRALVHTAEGGLNCLGVINVRGVELSTVVWVCKCLIRPATFTSIPCIISNTLNCSVCLMPYLTSSISTLSLLLIKSLKTLAMIDFCMLVRGLWVSLCKDWFPMLLWQCWASRSLSPVHSMVEPAWCCSSTRHWWFLLLMSTWHCRSADLSPSSLALGLGSMFVHWIMMSNPLLATSVGFAIK